MKRYLIILIIAFFNYSCLDSSTSSVVEVITPEEMQEITKVVVYCEKGGRSSKCVDKMKDAGFVKIYELDGGLAKWRFKGYDLEESKP